MCVDECWVRRWSGGWGGLYLARANNRSRNYLFAGLELLWQSLGEAGSSLH
jgi:hypothetical protein